MNLCYYRYFLLLFTYYCIIIRYRQVVRPHRLPCILKVYLSTYYWLHFYKNIGENVRSYILTLAEKVADNAALRLVESTKASDVDIVIVHAASDSARPCHDSARLKTCFMARTVRTDCGKRIILSSIIA